MTRYIHFTMAVAFLSCAIVAADVAAQKTAVASVKTTKSNFVAANGGNPPKADPQGTWTKPAKDGVDWKVSWDYGTKAAGGAYTLDGTIGVGGGTVTLPDADASGSWGGIGAENLKNPLPANTVIRARLLRMENSVWTEKAVDYLSIP